VEYFVIGYGENLDLPTIDIISRASSRSSATYPLEGINDAIADLDGGRLQGRGIMIPA
jgi:NAD+-dependent secondary alcohol dehydrogenase Adh1